AGCRRSARGSTWGAFGYPVWRTVPKPPPRIVISDPSPLVDCGRHPAKAVVGDRVEVGATIVRDGHEVLRAAVRYKGPGDKNWSESPLEWIRPTHGGNRWAGGFPV